MNSATVEKPTTEVSTPNNLVELQDTIRRVFRVLVAMADSGNNELYELPVGQFRCLRRVIEHEGCKLVDLARETNLSLPNASRLVDRLVQRKLVLRQTDQTDRRAVRLFATPEAHALIDAINEQRLKHISVATKTLNADQISQSLAQLNVLLHSAEEALGLPVGDKSTII